MRILFLPYIFADEQIITVFLIIFADEEIDHYRLPYIFADEEIIANNKFLHLSYKISP